MFVKIEGSLVNLDLVYNIDLNDDGTATLWFTGTENACRDVTVDDMKAIEAAIRHEYVVEDIESPASTFSGVNLEDIKNLSEACEAIDLEHNLKYAQGMTFSDGSVAFTAVNIGDQVWMSKNLAIDDGGEGVYYNPKNKEYYYTWVAATRIAKAIPGWHLPSVDEWNKACEACGVKLIEGIGYVEDARELYGRLKVLPAGIYNGSFDLVDSFAYLWAVTESGSAYYRGFDTDATMGQGSGGREYGYSIRLVKDK